MTLHLVDARDRTIDSDDLPTWLLFFLESHGAEVTLRADRSLPVNLNTMPGLDADTAHRWAPVIAKSMAEFGEILLARMRRRNNAQ